MISEMILYFITGIAGGLTASSLYFAYKSVKKYVNMKERKIDKYKLELEKQLLELEKMEKEIKLEEIESEDKGKYEDTKILINNLIEQYKNNKS